jgi:hypothetical protein
MSAANSDRHREVSPGDRAMPNLVTTFSLADESAAGSAKQVSKRAVELRRH